jgi:hypothetical protein
MSSLDVAKVPKLVNERTEKLVFPLIDWPGAYHEGYSPRRRGRLSRRLDLQAEYSGPSTAEERKQFPPSHSITSSARPSSASGTVMLSALAVLRFTISLNTAGRSIGNSLGFAPFRILSTYTAARRKMNG